MHWAKEKYFVVNYIFKKVLLRKYNKKIFTLLNMVK